MIANATHSKASSRVNKWEGEADHYNVTFRAAELGASSEAVDEALDGGICESPHRTDHLGLAHLACHVSCHEGSLVVPEHTDTARTKKGSDKHERRRDALECDRDDVIY